MPRSASRAILDIQPAEPMPKKGQRGGADRGGRPQEDRRPRLAARGDREAAHARCARPRPTSSSSGRRRCATRRASSSSSSCRCASGDRMTRSRERMTSRRGFYAVLDRDDEQLARRARPRAARRAPGPDQAGRVARRDRAGRADGAARVRRARAPRCSSTIASTSRSRPAPTACTSARPICRSPRRAGSPARALRSASRRTTSTQVRARVRRAAPITSAYGPVFATHDEGRIPIRCRASRRCARRSRGRGRCSGRRDRWHHARDREAVFAAGAAAICAISSANQRRAGCGCSGTLPVASRLLHDLATGE